MYPTSDLQFLAQVLVKKERDEPLSANEVHRLTEVAELGVSSQPIEILNRSTPRGED